MDTLEAQLKALREQMEKVLERREMPRLFKYAEAARLLSISPSKLKTLIRCGVIVPTTLGETRMISLTEIERVSMPRLPIGMVGATAPRMRGPRRAFSAKAEIGKLKKR